MFDPQSRYYAIEEGTLSENDTTTIRYKRRRFLPGGKDMTLLTTITVTEGERLDTIAARTLGDPALFWRVCDANNAMNPRELTEIPGRALRVAVPRY
jgi:hypothetical protein